MPSTNRYPKVNPTPRRGSRPSPAPRRALPRVEPLKPRPMKPAKFPGMPRPSGPFGKRMPLPTTIPPVVPRIALPWLRIAARLNPWLFAALTAYELWQLYRDWQPPQGRPVGSCRTSVGKPQAYGWFLDTCSSHQSRSIWRETPDNVHRWLHKIEQISPQAWQWATLEYWGPFPVEEWEDFPEFPPVGLPAPVPVPVLPPQPHLPIVPWLPISVPPLAPMPVPIPRPKFIPPPANPEDPSEARKRNPRYRPNEKPAPAASPRPRPPGRRVKERKLRASKGWVNRVSKLLGLLSSGYSEAGDLVDALHDALPKKYQGRDHPMAKLEALYEHWDKVDMNEAFTNIWKNVVSDRYQGKAFGQMQDALSEAGFDFPSPRDIGGQGHQFRSPLF